LDRFGDVFRGDLLRPGKVGNGAGDFQYAVISPGSGRCPARYLLARLQAPPAKQDMRLSPHPAFQ
jgi:hypothetical protein